jgi:hypothetical protein
MIDYNQGLIIQMKFQEKIELKAQLMQIKGIREQNKKNLEQKEKKNYNVIKFNLSENNVSVVGSGKK